MAATYPGVQEIAKAFEADPRTKLANAITQAGTSTAPVAGGGWAWVDGVSRALQGALGGYVTRKQLKKYGEDEAALLEQAKQTGAAGLASMGGQPVPQTPPAVPPAQAVPAPAQTPQAAPGGVDPNAIAAALSPAPQAPPQPSPGAAIPMAGATPMYVPGPAPVQQYAKRQSPQQGVAFSDPLAGKGGQPSSGFGPRKAPVAGASTYHTGVDYPAPEGTPVASAADGTVVAAWNDTKNGGGLSIRVRHPDGSVTGYAHLSAIGAKPGDTVQAGQPIGAVGKTGRATGDHLHFTYRDPSGKRQNPLKAISFGSASPSTQQGDAATSGAVGSMAAPEAAIPVPEAMARPEAPQAEAATQSPKLRQAYEMLQRGNKYEYNRGQQLLSEGLAEQGDFNERATGRKQAIKDATYQSDLGMYASDKSARLQDVLSENRSIRDRNWRNEQRIAGQEYSTSERQASQSFQSTEKQRDRDFEATQNALNRDAQWRVANAQIEAAKATREEKAAAKQQAFYTSPQGIKVMDSFKEVNDAASTVNAYLAQFEDANKKAGTGGLWGNYAPDAIQGSLNGNRQTMISLSNSLAQSLAGALKGALSDKDVVFVKSQVPSVGNSGTVNAQRIALMRSALKRSSDYQAAYVQSLIDGDNTFPQRWARYRDTVRITSGVTWEQFSKMRTVKF